MTEADRIRALTERVQLLGEVIDHYRRAARVLAWMFFFQTATLAVQTIDLVYRARGGR